MRRIIFFITIISYVASYADNLSSTEKNTKTPQSSHAEDDYVDKLINDGKTTPQFIYNNGFDESYDPSGIPSYYHIDLSEVYNTTNKGYNYREDGLSIGGQLDTIQYGSFSLEGSARSGTWQRPYLERHTSFYGVLAQRRLPFNYGWYANNFVGTIYTPSIDLVRRPSRFILPAFAVMGASTELIYTDKAQFQFSVGKPGLINGILLNEFNPIGGNTITGGAQYSLLPNLQLGIQTIINRNTPIYGPNSYSNPYYNQYLLAPNSIDNAFIRSNNQAIYASAAWENQNQYIQANYIQNHTQLMRKHYGAWLDSKAEFGRITSNQGLFYFEPEVSWGYSTITNDVQGGYYYANYNTRQWQLNSGVELMQYVSQPTRGIYLTGGVRYQATSRFGIGGNTSYRTLNNKDSNFGMNDSYGASLFFDILNSFGSETTQLDTRFDDQAYFHRLTLSQNWNSIFGTLFSTYVATGLAYTHNRPHANWRLLHSNYYGAGINVGRSIFQKLTLSGGVMYDHFNQEYFGHNISANTSINAQLSKHWSLISSYIKTYNNQTDAFIVQPLIQLPRNNLYFTSDTFLLTLRYQENTGTPHAPIGGNYGDASGTVIGYLSVDQTTNNTIPILQNVTVVIDGKFSTQTDAVGFFEFPYVTSGKHTLVIIKDNIPLPWTTSGPDKIIIDVSTRKNTKVVVPLINLNDSGMQQLSVSN